MKNIKRIISILVIFSLFTAVIYSADSTTSADAEPYNKEEFPQALKDLRRFEIITLGSMPFVMLDCNMVYSGILVAQGKSNSFNPLNMSGYTTEQQVGLILTSLAVSTGVGLTDLIVQNIKRNKKAKKTRKQQANSISVIPVEEDPDAVKIDLPLENSKVEAKE